MLMAPDQTSRILNAKAEATAAEAKVEVAANADQTWNVLMILWSYSQAPVGGSLKIEQDDVEIFDVDVTASGPGFLPFGQTGLVLTKGSKLEVMLSGAGAGTTGKLNVIYR
jgi:hypothetical protein